MSINFPTSIDTLTNPTGTDKQNSPAGETWTFKYYIFVEDGD